MNKSVFIKHNRLLSDNEIYQMLGFKQQYISEDILKNLRSEYKLGKNLSELGLNQDEFNSFDKYVNVIYDIYTENGLYFKWVSDSDEIVVDIDRNDDVVFIPDVYDRIFIDGQEIKNELTEDEFISKCNGNNQHYVVIYIEKNELIED